MLSSGKPLEPAFTCGRRHRHFNRRQVVECDQRLASREALKCEQAKAEEMMNEGLIHEAEA